MSPRVRLALSIRRLHAASHPPGPGRSAAPTSTVHSVTAQPDPDLAPTGWRPDRWAEILGRIDHRQRGIGLRFSGPPLWLEVTMTGPDSDEWPVVRDGDRQSWDWVSPGPCPDVTLMMAAGASDDRLLREISRYTVENLILNAIHEIGEWFRVDGRRVYPAHGEPASPVAFGTSRVDGAWEVDRAPHLRAADEQGNGPVHLQVDYPRWRGHGRRALYRSGPGRAQGDRLLIRLAEAGPPSRLTYLPGTSVSYTAEGPVVTDHVPGLAAATWASDWSADVLAAADRSAGQLLGLVTRDVHRALVHFEAQRICLALHIDGHRAWRLEPGTASRPTDPFTGEGTSGDRIALTLSYREGLGAGPS